MRKIRRNMMMLFTALLLAGILPSVQPKTALAAKVGIASYYSYECANSPMANGNMFDPEERTCAS